MLTSLSIQNFGLIDQITLEFGSGLNVFTGETGAGKSISLDALRITLGERITPDQLRDPDKPCVLQAEFDLDSAELRTAEILQDFLTDDETILIVHRTFTPDGKNKIKINGLGAMIGQLREIGNLLVDFHGPHDHQRLLSEEHHLGMLDRLIELGKDAETYRKLFDEFSTKQRQLNQLRELAGSREREVDLLSHQVSELQQVELDDEKYDALSADRVRMLNAGKLAEHMDQLLNLLNGDSDGSSRNISKAFHPLQRLTQLDDSAKSFLDRLSDVQAQHDQLVVDLQEYAAGLSFDSAEAERIEEVHDQYETIKRKYGLTLTEAKKFYLEAKLKLDLLTNLDQNEAVLVQAIETLRARLKTKAEYFTKERRKAALSLKKTIEKELAELGIPHVRFEARIDPEDFSIHGADRVIFYISPNAGEDLKPLADIVSSGEAARVMLALKKALVKVDPVPVLIFDEIDSQIGGRLGAITGEKLRELSRVRQVILITHLPQIASFADRHFKVSKAVINRRAQTNVSLLNNDERVDELAQMMSGQDTSEISVKHASAMLSKAKR